jgi:hypothetical protein
MLMVVTSLAYRTVSCHYDWGITDKCTPTRIDCSMLLILTIKDIIGIRYVLLLARRENTDIVSSKGEQ